MGIFKKIGARRSRLVILGEITGCVPPENLNYEPLKKRQIIDKAGLNYAQFEHFKCACEHDLITMEGNGGYVRTERGGLFLSLLYEMADALRSVLKLHQ